MEYAEKVRCYQNVVQKYCSRRCERIASLRREAEKKKKEKDNAESFRNAEKNNSLRDKAFLSPEDVSFNVNLPTVPRYTKDAIRSLIRKPLMHILLTSLKKST